MATAFNQVILIGNLTADPEIKNTNGGANYCGFTIAVQRKFGKNNEVDFIQAKAWRQTADFIAKYFKKGSGIFVLGRIETSSYTNAQGAKVRVTEIVVEEAKFVGGKGANTSPSVNMDSIPSAYGGNMGAFTEITDDDGGSLPF